MTTRYHMDEDEFWDLIAKLGWTRDGDFRSLKKKFMKLVPDPERAREVMRTCDTFVRLLSIAIERFEEKSDRHCDVGDDGFSDLVYHIIGLGCEEFNSTIDDPERAVNRAHENDFSESFAYVFPTDDDYNKRNNIAAFVDRAVEIKESYATLLDDELFDEIHKDVLTVSTALDKLINGHAAGFLECESDVAIAMTHIQAFRTRLRQKLMPIDDNIWWDKNMFANIKESFDV